jgi:hypothetical protein
MYIYKIVVLYHIPTNYQKSPLVFKYPLRFSPFWCIFIGMATRRFSVELEDDLCAWLDAEARIQNRSRNRQLAYILQTIKTQNEIRHNMQDERWLDMQARKFPPGDRIG